MKNIDRKYRNKHIIDKIRDVLKEWDNDGYKWFLLKRSQIPKKDLKEYDMI